MRNKITLKDIAEEIGVDTSTVSKALRNSSDISTEMQEKVKKYADKVGYRPNLLARTLINQKSNILGVIVPDLRISFFSEATRGIYEQATLCGYESILMVHDEKSEIEKKKLEFLSDLHVDGILLNAIGFEQNLSIYEKLQAEGIKIVCWDREIPELGFNSITIDDKQASFELTSKFIQEGRKNIMFVGPRQGISILSQRYEGYLNALKAHNIQIKDELILETTRSFESAYTKMLEFLKSDTKVDAIICIGGLVAYGVGNAVMKSGRNIPDDILLGEFGDNDRIARLGVPFYTVNQNPFQMGKEAVDLLVSCIRNDNECSKGKKVIIEHEIIYRPIGIQKGEIYSSKISS